MTYEVTSIDCGAKTVTAIPTPSVRRVSTGTYETKLSGSVRRSIARALRQANGYGGFYDWWAPTETAHRLRLRARTGIGSGVVRASVLLPS